MEELNRQFVSTSSSSRYFTMIFGIMDLRSGDVILTQAGHPPPLLFSARNDQAQSIGQGGMPLGMFDNAEFEHTVFTMQRGDRLFIYSDGAIECPSLNGEMYGPDRLENAVKRWAGVPIEKLSSILDKEFLDWNGTSRFEDDVSMVCLEYQPLLDVRDNVKSGAHVLFKSDKETKPDYIDETGANNRHH